MNKYWWFNLYSVHVMKHALKWTGLSILFDQLIGRSNLIDSWGSFLVFLPLYPLIRKSMSRHFRNNLEFHKMSVSFKELNQAFIIHSLLVFFFCYILTLTSYFISRYMGGVHSNVKYDLLGMVNISYILFFHFVILIFYLAFSQSDHLKRKYQFYAEKKNDFIGFLFGIGTSASFLTVTLILVFFLENEFLPFIISFSSFAFASWLYINRAIFHKVPEKASVFANIKYTGLGGAFFMALYFLCLLPGRNDVLNDNLKLEKRVSSYLYNGRFNPPIDIETFKVIEPKLFALNRPTSTMYKKIDFDPSLLGVDYFLDGKDNLRLLTFLESGKASPNFLIALYDHFDKNHESWKKTKTYPYIRYLSFYKWPTDEKLPVRFIADQISSRRDYQESQKKLKSRRRMPAAKN